MQLPYDAILLVAFGGPEGPDEVMPFLENVLRGRRVPRQRIEEVAAHYYHFGGVSPINAQCRQLIEALQNAMQARSWRLPVYWGNRNWHPLLEDTLRRMADDGVRRAVAVITSAYSSYSSCRQYLENIEAARKAVGHLAPTVDRIRPYFNHPAFVEAWTERLAETLQRLPDSESERWHVLFTAHSIPLAMAERCDYERQLRDVATCLSERLNIPRWNLVYQSRSGPPEQPWLEPDVCDFVRQTLTKSAISHVVVAPIGFLSDHMEVLYDLDVELKQVCDELGITMLRAQTVGSHPRFVEGLLDLVEERLGLRQDRPVVGRLPARPLDCAADCCPSGRPTLTPSQGP